MNLRKKYVKYIKQLMPRYDKLYHKGINEKMEKKIIKK